jgi:hypothetical protein
MHLFGILGIQLSFIDGPDTVAIIVQSRAFAIAKCHAKQLLRMRDDILNGNAFRFISVELDALQLISELLTWVRTKTCPLFLPGAPASRRHSLSKSRRDGDVPRR